MSVNVPIQDVHSEERYLHDTRWMDQSSRVCQERMYDSAENKDRVLTTNEMTAIITIPTLFHVRLHQYPAHFKWR